MQRVTRSTAAVALPAPPAGAGSPGFFTGGNPGTGTPATVPGFEWFNGVQEELMYVIEQAGLTGSSTDHTKLRQAIQLLVAAGTVPTGAIVSFPATAAPTGWLKANGVLLSRATYAGLWAFAQASGNIVSDATWLSNRPGSFSTGDGSTTFRIPDRRGLFSKGFHDGSGTYESDTGTPLGEYRDSQNKAHTHTFSSNGNGNGNSSYYPLGGSEYLVPTVVTTSSQGATESFPRHVLELYCIKY
jgi:microcystin-dependent protein